MICHSKPCRKCGAKKPLGEFHRHPGMADGHFHQCKACTNERQRSNYRKRTADEDTRRRLSQINRERYQAKKDQTNGSK